MPSLLFNSKKHKYISNYYRLKNKKMEQYSKKTLASESLHCTKREQANAEHFFQQKLLNSVTKSVFYQKNAK